MVKLLKGSANKLDKNEKDIQNTVYPISRAISLMLFRSAQHAKSFFSGFSRLLFFT